MAKETSAEYKKREIEPKESSTGEGSQKDVVAK